MIPLIIIEGPTASGKSAFALQLAEALNTEIISADSRQVYRYLNIGTAKPGKDDLAAIKHHMIDIINPDEVFNAGLFLKKAGPIIEGINSVGKIPIVCGGTGLYVKALLEGLFLSDIHDSEYRSILISELLEKGLEALYEELAKVDPLSAERINPKDKQRILRALEVYRVSGLPITEHWKRQLRHSAYKSFRIILQEDRELLYKRINDRVIKMLKDGLLNEISLVIDNGYSWDNPGFNSVGYKEFRPYLEDKSSISLCTQLAQQHTRNYAKRQITWYKKCNYNLSDRLNSINIKDVKEIVLRYFQNNTTEEINGSYC